MTDREKWDRIHASRGHGAGAPAQVLAGHLHLLPRRGAALDLACGRGDNALLLAESGLATSAWDISGEALDQLRRRAAAAGRQITVEQRDIIERPPEADSFDVIVVSRFLDRGLVPRLTAALRPAGLVFYQTFLAERVDAGGPRNPDYLLKSNELLELFRELRVLVYREEGTTGDTTAGFRNEAMLIAQKNG